MALQHRNITAMKENSRIKADVSKVSVVSRPALRPISNRYLPTKPITRCVTKVSIANKTTTNVTTKASLATTKPVTAVKASSGTNLLARKHEISKVNLNVTKPQVAPKPNVKASNSAKVESYSSQLNNVTDIDKDDDLSPQLAPPYANDIYAYLRDAEKKYAIKPAYLTGQVINGSMRSLLLNWIVEVHEEFRMFQESLHLSVAILDRFLQDYRNIDKRKLQLVGATCLFIAGKYEELFGPDICDLVFMSQGACTKPEIIEMECKILSTLDFNLGRPLPIHFLRRFSKAAKAEPSHHNLAKYIIELGLLDYGLCHHPPSLLAAASLYLSLWLFSGEKSIVEKLWTDTLVFYSTYSFSDIRDLVKSLAVLLVKAETSNHQALRKKYSASKYMKASTNSVLVSKQLKKLAMTPVKE